MKVFKYACFLQILYLTTQLTYAQDGGIIPGNPGAARPRWQRLKSSAWQYMHPVSRRSTQSAHKLLSLVEPFGWTKANYVHAKSRTDKTNLGRCIPLHGQPIQDCLFLDWDLLTAPKPYVSYVFVYGTAKFLLKKWAEKELTYASSQTKEYFFSRFDQIEEIELFAHAYALHHWQDLDENWPRVDLPGQLEDYDFFPPNHPDSVNSTYQLWQDNRDFLAMTFIPRRFQQQWNGKTYRLKDWLHDSRLGGVAQKIMRELTYLLRDRL